MTRRTPSSSNTRLVPRESVTTASTHFVFQIGGNVLGIIAVWTSLFGVLGVTGTIWSGWQGRVIGALVLAAGIGMFRIGKRLALENRVMKRRTE